jgi:hypothetical protein
MWSPGRKTWTASASSGNVQLPMSFVRLSGRDRPLAIVEGERVAPLDGVGALADTVSDDNPVAHTAADERSAR